MDETYTPPPTNTEDDPAAAAKRLMETPKTPNYGLRRAGAVAIGVGVIAGIGGIGQAIHNENAHEQQVTNVTEAYQHDQNILKEIHTEALKKVDPASIVGMFMINEQNDTINKLSLDIAHSQPEYVNGDEATKNFIDYTILESGKAQGSYDLKDNFVETKVKINGKDTLIVQNATGVAEQLQEQQLSTPDGDGSTVPATETH